MSRIAIATPEAIDVLGAPMIIVAGGGLSPQFLGDHAAPPIYGVPLHVHETEDEAFFILEGEITLLDGKGETRAKPGMFISLPRGVPHGYRNDTQGTARMLVLAGPQPGKMFRHLDRAKPVIEQVPAICGQYGVNFVPPTAP